MHLALSTCQPKVSEEEIFTFVTWRSIAKMPC